MLNNKSNVRRDKTGEAAANTVAGPSAYTAEQRETIRLGLRVLAKIIARVHLRRQAARRGPPPGDEGEQAIPEIDGFC